MREPPAPPGAERRESLELDQKSSSMVGDWDFGVSTGVFFAGGAAVFFAGAAEGNSSSSEPQSESEAGGGFGLG